MQLECTHSDQVRSFSFGSVSLGGAALLWLSSVHLTRTEQSLYQM